MTDTLTPVHSKVTVKESGTRDLDTIAAHRDRLNAWLPELFTFNNMDVHLCAGGERKGQHGLLANIRDDVCVLREETDRLARTLDAAIERAEKAEALIDRLRREAEQHAQEARTANATIAEIYQAVTDATGEPGNWNGAEPVRARLTALKARVAELEGALTEISKQTYGTEISMDGDERAEILGRHLAMRRSIAFTALKKDTPND